MGIEPRALYMLGKCSTRSYIPNPTKYNLKLHGYPTEVKMTLFFGMPNYLHWSQLYFIYKTYSYH
jgi:hypothetical protein